MLVLVSYDVQVTSPTGAKRLRWFAKTCQNYGVRVQQSLFECHIDSAQLATLRHALLEIIDTEADSLRFYVLGKKYHTKVEHYGVKPSQQPGDAIIV